MPHRPHDHFVGEPDEIQKGDDDPFLLSGCQLTGGTGRMIVIAVGRQSRWGRIKVSDYRLFPRSLWKLGFCPHKQSIVWPLLCFFKNNSEQDKLDQDTKDTPLQEKLDDMANLIG